MYWLLQFPGSEEPAPLSLPPTAVVERIRQACAGHHLVLTLPDQSATPILGIYLFRDPNLTATAALRVPLDRQILQDQPFLTARDLLEYRIPAHSLVLKPEARRRLPQPGVFGVPFVVTAYGRRVYLGAFWTSLSSSSFPKPVVDVSQGAGQMQRAYPTPSFGKGDDPRSHPLVLDALRAARILKE